MELKVGKDNKPYFLDPVRIVKNVGKDDYMITCGENLIIAEDNKLLYINMHTGWHYSANYQEVGDRKITSLIMTDKDIIYLNDDKQIIRYSMKDAKII